VSLNHVITFFFTTDADDPISFHYSNVLVSGFYRKSSSESSEKSSDDGINMKRKAEPSTQEVNLSKICRFDEKA
jgi:hypothetical protein